MKKYKIFFCAILLALTITLISTGQIYALTLFSEDFEGDLSVWTGKAGEVHHGVIVDDPKEMDKALRFNDMNLAGDIFSPLITNPSGEYILSFDYLGDWTKGGVQNNLGGLIGHSVGPGSLDHKWLAGTMSMYDEWTDKNYIDTLKDDGYWYTHQVTFTGPENIHLMLEDFVGAGGVAGDAYFDNIFLTDANGATPSTSHSPLPSTLLLFGSSLFGFAIFRRKLRRG